MKSTTNFKSEAQEIIKRINSIRQDPSEYVEILRDFNSCYKGNTFTIDKKYRIETNEGVTALNDLIKFMEKQKPENKLKVETGLCSTLEEFCNNVKSSEELNEYYSTFDSQKVGEKYGKYGNGRIQTYLMNSIAEDLEKNVLFLLLSDGDDTRQIRNLLMDKDFKCIGVYIKNYEGEDSPMLTLMLADNYKTNASNDDTPQETSVDPVNDLKEATKKLLIDLDKEKTQKNLSKAKTLVDDDPDLDLPEGVMKIEKKSKIVKEKGKEFVVTKIVTYMDDGSVNTEVTKEAK